MVQEISAGGGAGKSVKNAMQNVVNAVKAAAPKTNYVQQALAAGNAAARAASRQANPSLAKADEAIKNGTAGKATATQKVTYIGNNGARSTGTTASSGSSSADKKVTPGTTPDYYNQMQALYQKAYDDQVAANNAALEAARQRAQETTDAQIAALGEQYAGTNRQLYRDYMNSRRVLPQQMAAQGYSGGLSESSMLRLNNSYEEGLNENERARLAQETSYNQALAQQMFEAQQKTNEANQSAQQQLYGQRAAIQEAIYKDAQQRAATMAASGDFSEYKRLGFSDSEIAYLKNMWRKMNPSLA